MARNNDSKNTRVGCLLVHGFTGSPNELADLRQFLRSKNLTLSVPTLPGHGTYSGDMFNYTWQDWADQIEKNYEELQEACDEVFAIGLSMGGALVLNLAVTHAVTGIVTMAAPVQFPVWQKVAVKVLKKIGGFRKKKNGEDIRDTSARPKLGSYRRYPFFAIDQLFQLVDHVREQLQKITQPILILHSRKDHTIPFKNSEILFEGVSSQHKHKVDFDESYHILPMDVEKERVQQEVWQFILRYSEIISHNS